MGDTPLPAQEHSQGVEWETEQKGLQAAMLVSQEAALIHFNPLIQCQPFDN